MSERFDYDGLLEVNQTLRAENARLKEALEQIAKWDKRSQSETAQSFAKAALQPERGAK